METLSDVNFACVEFLLVNSTLSVCVFFFAVSIKFVAVETPFSLGKNNNKRVNICRGK